MLGAMIAFAGLGAVLSFAQTAKHQAISKFAETARIALFPATISLIWFLSLNFGWWTILLFVVLSIAVGIFNGIWAKKFGRNSVYVQQPTLAVIFLAASLACWFV